MTVYKVVSLFAGCGGMDLGFKGGFSSYGKEFKSHNFDIVWANELNEKASDTYRANIGDHIITGDIWQHLDDLPDEKIDVVLGGFPCQDISINNIKAKGVFGERSGLYKAMVEAVDRLKPRIFVAENVKALLNSNNKKSLEQVLKNFTDIGYNVSYKLYNTADFGVCQTRERVIIVGTRDCHFQHMEPMVEKKDWLTASQVLFDLEELEQDADWSHIWSLASRGSHQGNRKLYPDRPGYTMRAECHGNTHYHYKLDRRISMREGARIQSFPDDFIFQSKLRDTERQVGNAVPPVFAWHLAGAVYDALEGVSKPSSTGQFVMDL